MYPYQAGQPRTRVRQVPVLLLRALAIADRTGRERLEMGYQCEGRVIFDSTDVRDLLGVHATTMERGLELTVEAYRKAAATR